MRNGLWKKGFVVGIIMLFVGASVIPSVLGKNHSRIDQISEKLIQTNTASEVDEKVFYTGNITVWVQWSLFPIIDFLIGRCVKVIAECNPDTVINHSMAPGSLKITTIANITLQLDDNFKMYRGGFFEYDLTINNNKVNFTDDTLKQKNFGTYTGQFKFIHTRNISENTTLTMFTDIAATPILGQLKCPW